MNFKPIIKDWWYLLKFIVPQRGCSILMYHSVSLKDGFFTVRPTDFEWQMAYLKSHNFKIISLAELADHLINRKKVLSRTIVLTFDDGYQDNYFNVFPILKKYNFPATIFLNTNFVGGERESRSQKMFLKMLDWAQIEEMQNSGLVDFQPHTLGHPKLANLSVEEARREILESRQIIEEKLNKKCLFFSYPYGDYNQSIIKILRDNNFSIAVTVEPGKIVKIKKGSDLFELPRHSIDRSTTKIQFMGKI